ncbi:unnamed protein product, partial [Polarella glacialis]
APLGGHRPEPSQKAQLRAREYHFAPSVLPVGTLFDQCHRFLPNGRFDTWDKGRCSTPQRTWPTDGAVATLYDEKRKGKVGWKALP